MKHLHKRIIIIASYVILGIAVIALTGALILTIGSSAVLSNNLNSKNEALQSKLDHSEEALQSQKTLTEQYRAEAEQWKDKFLNSDPDNVTYSDSFNSVKELNAAIKKNPTYYNNKRIKVVGTIIKYDNEDGNSFDLETYIVDDNGSDFSTYDDFDFYIWMRYNRNSEGIIPIEITDDLQYTVVETGDYVKMYGTVKISNGEIYLTDCEYSMIATRDER